jgi:uncharacterized protein (TIGR00369 family)
MDGASLVSFRLSFWQAFVAAAWHRKLKSAHASACYANHLAFENDLGLKVTRKHKDGVTIELPLRDELLNAQGNLHGGVTASIADEAAWHAMISHYGERNATTTELKVNYLRPIVGKKVIARAYMLKAGATLCVTRIDLFGSDKKLAAVAVVTYMLLTRR